MTKLSPQIDLRNQENLVHELRKLSAHYCSNIWDGEEDIAADGQAEVIIQVYARMMETVIRRLNRAPDKNFLAFIDLLGLNLLPPRPARTALSFALAKGAEKDDVYVAAGTQIASEESPDDKPVIFEIDESLTVISPSPVQAVSMIADQDRWRDHGPVLFNEENKDTESLFEGEDLIPHRLYLGHNHLFSFEEPRSIKLIVEGNSAFKEVLKDINWYAWSEDSEEALKLVAKLRMIENEPIEITFGNVSVMPERAISGYEKNGNSEKSWTNRWIYAELAEPLAGGDLPQITSLKTTIVTSLSEKFIADLAFFNTFPLDLTKDFMVFGERPKFNDTFYIASKEVFSKNRAAITLSFTFSEGILPPKTEAITLLWEYWDGKKWGELGRSEKTVDQSGNEVFQSLSAEYEDGTKSEFEDGTKVFTVGGDVKFNCPPIQALKVNGEENYWVRVRILKGNYGVEASYKEETDANGGIKYIYVPATYKPPSFASLTISFIPEPENFQEIVTYNNFYYESHPVKMIFLPAQPAGLVKPGEPVTTVWPAAMAKKIIPGLPDIEAHPSKTLKPIKVKRTFTPFTRSSDKEASLYIAFDKDISDLPVTLFFPLLSGDYVPPLEGAAQESPRLLWQYWNGSKWSVLMVEDYTKELTKREMVKFLTPEAVKKKACFNKNLYWIRALLTEGDFSSVPKLSGIYGNAVWAKNIVSIKREILGSSNGDPEQIFTCSQMPVLPGQEISVRETSISDREKEQLLKESGENVIKEIKDDAENVLEMWVLWREVDHFYFSGAHDRHYVLDRKTGSVTFGDGIKGMIPPTGKDNLRCTYKAGGGIRGNLGSGKISKLRSNIPYVDSVTNPVASEGGTDQENLDEIKIRAPRTIRHRNRAVTFKDYEWIAKEASPKVARVKCLPVSNPLKQFKPGWVTVIIVPDLIENKPLPTEELLEEVRNYVFERTASNLISPDIAQVNVIPPNYLGVNVLVDVAFKSISEAKITESRISEKLDRFFHPLTGGPHGKGWEFGRNVYVTEVYEMLEKVKGVDYVKDIQIDANLQIVNMKLKSPFTVSYNFPRQSTVSVTGTDMVFLLAEQVHKNKETDLLKVTGFKEGDFVEIYKVDEIENENRKSLTVRIKSLSGAKKDTLNFESELIKEDLPEGSIVETFLQPEGQRVRSSLTSALEKGKQSSITVKVPEDDDEITFTHRDWPSNRLEGAIQEISDKIDTIFLEEDYLVYLNSKDFGSAASLDKNDEVPEEKDISRPDRERLGRRYLMNLHSGEVHDLWNITPLCNIDRILKRHKRHSNLLDEIKTELEEMDYDYCGHCFPYGMSKR